MKLLDLISPESIRAPLVATDKRGVINELVDVLVELGGISDPTNLKDAVWSREQTRTTGVGAGLAIPHGKCPGVDKLSMAIGKPAQPMEFEAIDGQPVKLIVLLASPPDKTSDHIQALAQVSRMIGQADFRAQIYAAESSREIYDLLAARQAEG